MEESDTTAFDASSIAEAADTIWMFFCLVLVTLMQPGFACYEVGTISGTSHTRPILLKNIGDASVSFAGWFMFGYAFASGNDFGGILGTSYFFFTGDPFEETSEQSTELAFLRCLFGWSFAAACTTIVSGAVADRIPFKAYIMYAFLTSALFYPILAHWVWAEDGFASASRNDPFLGCGVLDFAGSGVVHMCGGGIGLLIAKLVKSRKARFFPPYHWDYDAEGGGGSKLKNHTNRSQIQEADFSPNDLAWMTLGCFLLWIGWYAGFNAGSSLQISTPESRRAACRAAMNTTIAAAFGCIFSMLIENVYHIWSPSYRRGDDIEDPLHFAPSNWKPEEADAADPKDRTKDPEALGPIRLADDTLEMIKDHRSKHNVRGRLFGTRDLTWPYSTHINLHGAAVNGILAGLVGITAGCATMSHGSAVWVSFVSALLYHVSYRGIICMQIDDSVGAGAIHFVGGAWGLLAAGFTSIETARVDAGYPSKEECSGQSQFVANLLATILICIYAILCTGIIWCVLNIVPGLLKMAEEGDRHIRPEDRALEDFKKRVERQDLANKSLVKKLKERLDKIDPGSANDETKRS